jgi:hypothetical protein
MNEDEQKQEIRTVLAGRKTSSAWYRRHHDWRNADKIEIEAIPRYKTGGLSGDEWRVGYRVRVFFKGALWVEYFRTQLEGAIAHLQYEIDRAGDEGLGIKFLQHEEAHCSQPGCNREAMTTLGIKNLFSNYGEKLDPEEKTSAYYRRFCGWHLRRGDSSREDCDGNYFHVNGPADPTPRKDDESPAAFRGVVDLREGSEE